MTTTKFQHGDKVSFVRGMFGTWHGTVVKTYKTRGSRGTGAGAGRDMVVIAYTRRDGSFGEYRARLCDVKPAGPTTKELTKRVDYLLALAADPFESPHRVAARNQLMDIGDALCKEVCAFGDFEDLLAAWGKHQYRPTLSVRDPKAKLLADIYDFTQAVRGVSVVAFRSHG